MKGIQTPLLIAGGTFNVTYLVMESFVFANIWVDNKVFRRKVILCDSKWVILLTKTNNL